MCVFNKLATVSLGTSILIWFSVYKLTSFLEGDECVNILHFSIRREIQYGSLEQHDDR